MKKLQLTIKYFLQGDSWKDASEYAEFIIKAFKRH